MEYLYIFLTGRSPRASCKLTTPLGWRSAEWITRQVAATHPFVPKLAKCNPHKRLAQGMEETLDTAPGAGLCWCHQQFWLSQGGWDNQQCVGHAQWPQTLRFPCVSLTATSAQMPSLILGLRLQSAVMSAAQTSASPIMFCHPIFSTTPNSLTQLKLSGYTIILPQHPLCFSSLKSMHISHAQLYVRVLEWLTSSTCCPVLETLQTTYCNHLTPFKISLTNPALRHLLIDNWSCGSVVICAPHVTRLELGGKWRSTSYVLKDVSSLTKFTLCFTEYIPPKDADQASWFWRNSSPLFLLPLDSLILVLLFLLPLDSLFLVLFYREF